MLQPLSCGPHGAPPGVSHWLSLLSYMGCPWVSWMGRIIPAFCSGSPDSEHRGRKAEGDITESRPRARFYLPHFAEPQQPREATRIAISTSIDDRTGTQMTSPPRTRSERSISRTLPSPC